MFFDTPRYVTIVEIWCILWELWSGGDGLCIHVRTSIDVRYFLYFCCYTIYQYFVQAMIVRSCTIHKNRITDIKADNH